MKQCPVCQKQVSDFAVNCPHCKAPLNTKTQHIDPVVDVVAEKSAAPVKTDYLSIILLSLILFFISRIIRPIELRYVALIFGTLETVACSVLNNRLTCIILTAFSALLISLIMRFYHRRSSSIKGFTLVSLVVLAVFCLFHFVLSFLILPPQVFFSQSEIVNQVKETLPIAIPFNTLLYPGYVLISYYGILALGRKKGYLAAIIGAFLLVIVMFLRSVLPVAMDIPWTGIFFVGFPALSHLLFIGVITVMKINVGKR
jgi:hypothetical protein